MGDVPCCVMGTAHNGLYTIDDDVLAMVDYLTVCTADWLAISAIGNMNILTSNEGLILLSGAQCHMKITKRIH